MGSVTHPWNAHMSDTAPLPFWPDWLPAAGKSSAVIEERIAGQEEGAVAEPGWGKLAPLCLHTEKPTVHYSGPEYILIFEHFPPLAAARAESQGRTSACCSMWFCSCIVELSF